MKLLLCVHLSHQFLGASRARRFLLVFLFPGVRILSVFLSPHMRVLDWILAWVPLLFPGAGITASFFFGILLIDGIAQILRRVLPRSERVVQHQIHGFDFAIAGFTVFGFAIGERPSLEVASCPLFEMTLCFLIGSERKLLKWLQENIEKFMMLNKRRR